LRRTLVVKWHGRHADLLLRNGVLPMMVLRKLTPGGYEYLTDSVACGDRELDAGEGLADYYTAHGYPPGEWFGNGAATLGLSGEVTHAQMTALFGEGRHPNADVIETDLVGRGATPAEAMRASQLGRRFPQYGAADELRAKVIAGYRKHNADQGRAPGIPISPGERAGIRRRVQVGAFRDAHEGRGPVSERDLPGG
jgi:hypothetical protein